MELAGACAPESWEISQIKRDNTIRSVEKIAVFRQVFPCAVGFFLFIRLLVSVEHIVIKSSASCYHGRDCLELNCRF